MLPCGGESDFTCSKAASLQLSRRRTTLELQPAKSIRRACRLSTEIRKRQFSSTRTPVRFALLILRDFALRPPDRSSGWSHSLMVVTLYRLRARL